MNLIDEAESLMLHQFRNSTKLIGLIRSLVAPLGEVDQLLQSMHHGRYIDEAASHRLDILGRIVGQPRNGMDDDDYRAWIKVAIKLNIGSGTIADLLAILSILYGKNPEVELQERPPNNIVFSFFSLPHAPLKALFAILSSACPVSTKCSFIRADVGASAASIRLAGLEPHKAKQIFRFDLSPFPEAFFADFFKEY